MDRNRKMCRVSDFRAFSNNAFRRIKRQMFGGFLTRERDWKSRFCMPEADF